LCADSSVYALYTLPALPPNLISLRSLVTCTAFVSNPSYCDPPYFCENAAATTVTNYRCTVLPGLVPTPPPSPPPPPVPTAPAGGWAVCTHAQLVANGTWVTGTYCDRFSCGACSKPGSGQALKCRYGASLPRWPGAPVCLTLARAASRRHDLPG